MTTTPSQCQSCAHNTGLDDSMIVSFELNSRAAILPPNCDINIPQFPNALQCSHYYQNPIDGD